MFCAGHLQGGVDSCQVSKENLLVKYMLPNVYVTNSDDVGSYVLILAVCSGFRVTLEDH